MKLYLSTNTANLNNIFASDSISPLGTYAQRKFGNRHFYPIEANPLPNALILFSKLPWYVPAQQQVYTDSIVLEIESDAYHDLFVPCGSIEDIKVFACFDTIYLSPLTTKIYCDQSRTLHHLNHLAEQSIENKSFSLYQCCDFRDAPWFNFHPSYIDPIQDYIQHLNAPAYDPTIHQKIDRYRGLLCCFARGEQLSIDDKVAQLRALNYEIRNTLSSALSTNQPVHSSQRNKLFSALDQFAKFAPSKSYGDYNQWLNVLLNEYDKATQDAAFMSKSTRKKRACDGIAEFKDDLNKRVVELNKSASSNAESKLAEVKLSSLLTTLGQESLGFKNEFSSELYQGIASLLINGVYQDKVNDVGTQVAIAHIVGSCLKDKYGESAPQFQYVKALLDNIQDGNAFSLDETKYVELKSFAAFCLRSNQDQLGDLEEFLVENRFSKFSYAFGLYGATYGYSVVDKTLFFRSPEDTQSFKEMSLASLYLLAPKMHLNREFFAKAIGSFDPALLDLARGSTFKCGAAWTQKVVKEIGVSAAQSSQPHAPASVAAQVAKPKRTLNMGASAPQVAQASAPVSAQEAKPKRALDMSAPVPHVVQVSAPQAAQASAPVPAQEAKPKHTVDMSTSAQHGAQVYAPTPVATQEAKTKCTVDMSAPAYQVAQTCAQESMPKRTLDISTSAQQVDKAYPQNSSAQGSDYYSAESQKGEPNKAHDYTWQPSQVSTLEHNDIIIPEELHLSSQASDTRNEAAFQESNDRAYERVNQMQASSSIADHTKGTSAPAVPKDQDINKTLNATMDRTSKDKQASEDREAASYSHNHADPLVDLISNNPVLQTTPAKAESHKESQQILSPMGAYTNVGQFFDDLDKNKISKRSNTYKTAELLSTQDNPNLQPLLKFLNDDIDKLNKELNKVAIELAAFKHSGLSNQDLSGFEYLAQYERYLTFLLSDYNPSPSKQALDLSQRKS